MFDSLTIRTTQFWITLLFQAGVVAAILADSLPPEQGALLSGLSVLAYTVSRTITKYRGDYKRGWRTTEFWFALGSTAVAAIATVQDNFGAEKFAAFALVLATAMKVSRALVTARLVDTQEV